MCQTLPRQDPLKIQQVEQQLSLEWFNLLVGNSGLKTNSGKRCFIEICTTPKVFQLKIKKIIITEINREYRNARISCSGKKQYRTFGAATYDARQMRRHGKKGAVDAYFCKSCRYFHVGHVRGS